MCGLTLPLNSHGEKPESCLFVVCADAGNDLYRVLVSNGIKVQRLEKPEEAAQTASNGKGILILADQYPNFPTEIEPAFWQQANEKNLRVFIEFPQSIPGIKAGKPRRTDLERAVVISDAFGDDLKPNRIVAIHDCHFIPIQASSSYIVLAKVAGFDTAVFGLDDVTSYPLLFEYKEKRILVSTAKLSQFVTGRYAPKKAWQAIWKMILQWLQPEIPIPVLEWTPTVRPSYTRNEPLPPDAAKRAVIRGVDWHTNAKMLIHESWKSKYNSYRETGVVDPANPVGPLPDPTWPAGDGAYGVLEGFSSRIRYNGTQGVRWWLRSDSNGESSLAFALRSKLDGDPRSRRIAMNLLDWVYFHSGLFQDDPEKANWGLVRWAWDSGSLYGDNDVKIILGCIGTSSILETSRWDAPLLKNILANYRTTGVYGFRGAALNTDELLNLGWKHYWERPTIHYAPHYQAWIWAVYLWLYDKTGYEPLLTRTRSAIRMMMEAYPDQWQWTNGIQQERGRMLLTLAWLIRVDDRPEHRAWLKQMAEDMRQCQDSCGAIREELGNLKNGGYRPPQSNAEYGENEASLIQENGDPVADLLYTCNFSFLGLHEAYAATGDIQYQTMEDRLAAFLVRIQAQSAAHPELDGGWFRAFDYERWEYWGSNADAGWGAWSIETGWTQAWIPTVLALRELGLNLWDVSRNSRIADHWDVYQSRMLGDVEYIK